MNIFINVRASENNIFRLLDTYFPPNPEKIKKFLKSGSFSEEILIEFSVLNKKGKSLKLSRGSTKGPTTFLGQKKCEEKNG